MVMNIDTSQICESDTRREIRSEIEQLAGSIARIYDLFLQVAKTLDKIDRKDIFNVAYAPKWRDLLTRYKELVLQSQSNASVVRAMFDVVLASIANYKNNHQGLSANLALYIQDLDKWAATAKHIDVDYTTLNEDITMFKSNLEEHIVEVIEEADEQYKSDLKEVNKNIATIQKMLSKRSVFPDIFRKISSLRKDKKPGISSGLFIGPRVISALAPEAASKYLPSNLLPADISGPVKLNQTQRNKLKAELEELKSRKKTLTSSMTVQLKNLDDAREMIETDLAPIFDEIMSRISIVAHVWHVLYMDVNSLKFSISNSDAQFALEENRSNLVEHFKHIYTALSFSIDAFVSVMPFGRANVPGADPHDFVDKMSNLVLGPPSEGVDTHRPRLFGLHAGARAVGLFQSAREALAGSEDAPNPDNVTGAAERRGNAATQDVADRMPSTSNAPAAPVRTASTATEPPLARPPLASGAMTSVTGISLRFPRAAADAVDTPLETPARYRENAGAQDVVDHESDAAARSGARAKVDGQPSAVPSLAAPTLAGDPGPRGTRISTGGLQAVAAAVERRGGAHPPGAIALARSAGPTFPTPTLTGEMGAIVLDARANTASGAPPGAAAPLPAPSASRPTGTQDGMYTPNTKIPDGQGVAPLRAPAAGARTPSATLPLTDDARAKGTGNSDSVVAPAHSPGAIALARSAGPSFPAPTLPGGTGAIVLDAKAHIGASHTAAPAGAAPLPTPSASRSAGTQDGMYTPNSKIQDVQGVAPPRASTRVVALPDADDAAAKGTGNGDDAVAPAGLAPLAALREGTRGQDARDDRTRSRITEGVVLLPPPATAVRTPSLTGDAVLRGAGANAGAPRASQPGVGAPVVGSRDSAGRKDVREATRPIISDAVVIPPRAAVAFPPLATPSLREDSGNSDTSLGADSLYAPAPTAVAPPPSRSEKGAAKDANSKDGMRSDVPTSGAPPRVAAAGMTLVPPAVSRHTNQPPPGSPAPGDTRISDTGAGARVLHGATAPAIVAPRATRRGENVAAQVVIDKERTNSHHADCNVPPRAVSAGPMAIRLHINSHARARSTDP